MDWSHMWLPHKNSQNQIKVMREPHMKHNVTQLEGNSEPVNFSSSVLGNHFLELEQGNYQGEKASCESNTQSELRHFSQTDDINCNIVNFISNIGSNTNKVDLEDRFLFLYFDGSKTQDGSGASCVLIDPKKNKQFLSCRLEFECTNNIDEYEALVQGLRKAVDIKVRNLKVFGDSKVVFR